VSEKHAAKMSKNDIAKSTRIKNHNIRDDTETESDIALLWVDTTLIILSEPPFGYLAPHFGTPSEHFS